MRLIRIVLGTSLLVLASGTAAQASSIACPTAGTYNRQATFDGAIACAFSGPVTGTPSAGDVATEFGGTWTPAGELAGSSGTNDWLTGIVTGGSWGSLPVSGTWGIDPAFWGSYGRAVITFHLGNGGGDPDWFFFEIDPNATSGTWSIAKLSGGGGGFSNMKLWGTGTPTTVFSPCGDGECAPVPEPASLILLGTGLTIAAARMRKRRPKR